MKQPLFEQVRSWVALTARERGVVAAILGFFLLGLIARHAALKRERPDPVRPGEIGNLEEEP
jgi:hypothetical protein